MIINELTDFITLNGVRLFGCFSTCLPIKTGVIAHYIKSVRNLTAYYLRFHQITSCAVEMMRCLSAEVLYPCSLLF